MDDGLQNPSLFKDVRIELKGNVVVVVLEERPLISAINFVGIKEFDKDTLKKALKDIGLSEGRPFDKALTDRAEPDHDHPALEVDVLSAARGFPGHVSPLLSL